MLYLGLPHYECGTGGCDRLTYDTYCFEHECHGEGCKEDIHDVNCDCEMYNCTCKCKEHGGYDSNSD